MSKTFSEAEKQRIEATLLETGRYLFAHVGLKKTSLDDLTRPAGIAKSSFYAFFPSKEALYWELIRRELPQVQERILNASFRTTDNMREAIERCLFAAIEEVEANDLTRRLIAHPEEITTVANRLPEDIDDLRVRQLVLPVVPLIEQAQAAGKVIAGNPEVLAGVLRCTMFLTLLREVIGRDQFAETLKEMVRVISLGMTAVQADRNR